MNKKILCIASLLLLFIGHISAVDHLWEFNEGSGNIAYDSKGGRRGRDAVNGVLNNAQWIVVDDGYGVQITGADNSYVSFANPIGQFGTQDFTVAFWLQTNDRSLALADLVGNRAAPGHGNFFAVRMTNDGYVSAEVDQDAAGTNYIGFRSTQNGLNDGRWHHVAVVRSGRTLTLYIDGAASNSGTGAGVANINNGVVFKIGRSLVDPGTPRFAPRALFDDLATYDSALSASDIAELAGSQPQPQPRSQDHLWEFDEGRGNIAYDSEGGRNPVNGVLNNAQWKEVDDGYGVQITGADNSYVSFANPIGQFGTQDFTVAFWFQTNDKSLSLADLVGNRAAPGHGNFFAVRMTNDGYVSAEVDQDAAGTNYIGLRSNRNRLNDGRWHHVAVVRSGRNLVLYIDGLPSNSGNSAGVANINNGLVFKIGRSLVDPNTPRFAPKALFDDLATYNSALSANDIADLAGVDLDSRDHLWVFDEGSGNIAYDSEGGRNPVNGVLNNAQWVVVDDGYGVQITGADNSYVSFANPIGQFGTRDFTVAFWFQTNDKSLALADLVGNRAAPGHGNFFAVRMTNDGYVSAEVDQDTAGTNYIGLRSTQNKLNDGNWHHVAVVRSGRTLTLYVDGYASNSGNSAGVANINNGLIFKIGRSLVDRNTPRFAPRALFDDLATYDSALSAEDIAEIVGVEPQPQPQNQNHLWTFDEGTGNTARDSAGGRNAVNGVLNNAQWIDLSKVGPGAAVRITGADNSYVSFANPIGQFGTQDFTVAFWFQTTDNSLPVVDLVGNRAAPGHGNFFSTRLSNDGYVSAEVDQDGAGTNYIGFRSTQKGLNDGNWHQVVVTRSGRTLTLYIDGAASNSGSAGGVANINNNVVFKIGRSLVDRNTARFAPDATFDDLATYNYALNANQVNQLYQSATNQ